MFLLSSSLLHLVNKFSLISNKNLLVSWAKMMKSSKEGKGFWNKRWSYVTLNWRFKIVKS